MRQKDAKLILIVILLLSGLYLLRPVQSKAPGSSSASSMKPAAVIRTPTPREIEKSIDQHMKLGRRSEELSRELTAIESKIQAPAIDPAQIDSLVNTEEPIPLKLQAEDAAVRAYRETIEKPRGRSESAMTPEQRITNKINRDQWEKNYREMYEQEYVRAYKENARKAGYDVKLNQKGEILEVVDFGIEEPVRFPQSVDESGKKNTPVGNR